MQSTTLARWLFVACALLACVVLFQPHPTIASSVVARLAEGLADAGAPAFMTVPGRVEAVLNAGLFVPVAALAMVAFPRLRWAETAVAGFLGSLGVEVFQGLFLAHRTAQSIDIVANTTGAVLGAVLVATLRGYRHRRSG